MDRRWTWLTRPRWQVAAAGAVLLLAWLFWPITVYEIVGRTRGFGIVLPGSSERTPRTISVTPHYEGPWKTRSRLEQKAAAAPVAERITGLGDRGFWFWDDSGEDRKSGQLKWVRGNIEFSQKIRGPFEEHESLSPGWIGACERVARQTDAMFLKGKSGTKEIRRHRIPRTVLWMREQVDIRRRKAGTRTRGWWKDW